MVTVQLLHTPVQVTNTWQVYVTSVLKIKLSCFFTVRPMVWYLNLLAVLKFVTTQNQPKRAETK